MRFQQRAPLGCAGGDTRGPRWTSGTVACPWVSPSLPRSASGREGLPRDGWRVLGRCPAAVPDFRRSLCLLGAPGNGSGQGAWPLRWPVVQPQLPPDTLISHFPPYPEVREEGSRGECPCPLPSREPTWGTHQTRAPPASPDPAHLTRAPPTRSRPRPGYSNGVPGSAPGASRSRSLCSCPEPSAGDFPPRTCVIAGGAARSVQRG